MDNMTMGTQTCDANGVFGACLPCTPVGGAGGAGAMGGMSGAGAMGGMGGAGAMGGMGGMGSGGMGSGGMMSMDDDSGVDDDDAGVELDAGSDSGTGPGDTGEQNGPCGMDDACDDNLGCYQPDDTQPAFCTLECEEDMDCEGLGGAEWSCGVMIGLCRVDCSDNGDDDCPDGFECGEVLGQDRCVPIE